MADHRIPLRRAWEARFGDDARRLDLPTVWGDSEIPASILRRFHWPARVGDGEVIHLELDELPGMTEATLNGRTLGDSPCLLSPNELRPSGNLLVLALDPSAVTREGEWGRVALVIGPRRVAEAARSD